MKILKLIFNQVLPHSCAVCNKELLYNEQFLCLNCYSDMPLTYFWNVKENPAEVVFWGRCNVERVYSLYYYTNNYRKPIHQLKYNSNVRIGLYLGQMLGEKIAKANGADFKIDYIIAVPLHWRKKLLRGYNQSEIIAKGIINGFKKVNPDSKLPIILSNIIKRRKFTGTQTKRDRISRWENVAKAFSINPRARKVPGSKSHVMLIDDVLTTGATLDACCNILQENYKCKVSIATLAYVE